MIIKRGPAPSDGEKRGVEPDANAGKRPGANSPEEANRGENSTGRAFFSADEEEHLRHQAKAELRKRMRAIRRKLPPEARASRSEEAAVRLVQERVYKNAGVIASYAAMAGELDPAAVVRRAREEGKRIVLPRVDWSDERMRMHEVRSDAELEESGMGFLQPAADAPLIADSDIDLVLVPALYVDMRGYRIGWGKGFYDRLLPNLKSAQSVAMVYDFQVVPEVPNTTHDIHVHAVVSDRQLFYTAAESNEG